MISIIIPTFNNLKYLDLCINSIKKNSYFNNEILLHINEGTDGSLKFAKEKKIKFTYSPTNDGLCIGCNIFYMLMMICTFFQIGIFH